MSRSGRSPGTRARRGGLTLVELCFGLALACLLGSLAVDLWSAAARQGEQVEEVADLLRATLVLHTTLANDLERALPGDVLPAGERSPGVWREAIRLPLYRSYLGNDPTALRFRPVEYRFDGAGRRLLRDGKPIAAEGLAAARFRWSEEDPPRLEVELKGQREGPGAASVLRLSPAWGASGRSPWRLAPHHRGARPEG